MIKKVIILFIASLLFPCTGFSFVQENWPTYMGNQYLTGNNDSIIPDGDQVIWKFHAPGRLYNPVGINERVYVVSTDKYLYCLNIKDGSILWKFKAEGALTRMVVVYQGRVYLPAGRFLYCIDEKTGSVLWGRRDPSVGFYGTPTIAEGKIFYGNRKGFFARELRNGHSVWENKEIYTYGGFPSYWYGMVYTVSKEFQKESARLVALNESDGTIRWEVALQNVSNIYSPVVYNEKIYLAYGKQIAVFNAESGKRLFEKYFLSQVASHPVFSQGKIYISLIEGTIIKIDPETGNWEPLFKVPFGTQFAAIGSYLFIPVKDAKGGFAVVDSVSGRELRRITTSEGEPSSLTVSRGIAFVPSKNTLLAIGRGQFLGTVSAKLQEPGEEKRETLLIRGEVKERDTGRPLSGKVEASTKFEDGIVQSKEKNFTGGAFEIEVPKEGSTDLIFSSKGYTFETITLPDEKAVDDLTMEPLELTLSKAETGETISIGSIHYEVGSANLEPNSIPTLQNLLQMMKENPSIKIEIAGHTDATGSAEVNMTLSKKRAESVASWLIQNGLLSKRISTIGFGDTRPIADTSTEEGRRKNRRTEITILE